MSKRNRVITALIICVLQFTIAGCSKEKPSFNIVELSIDKQSIALTPNNTSTVNILTGNGEYSIVSSDNDIAKATISGNTITITATSKQELANAVIVITDKAFKRTTIDVVVAKIFELSLNKLEAALEVGVPNKNETEILINTGNTGYNTELLANAAQLVELDKTLIESHGKLKIKAIAAGTAKVKLTDAKGKEATITLTITAPNTLSLDKTSISLNAVQGTEVVTVNSGNGGYKATVANPLVAKASVNGNAITIKGKTNGTTTVVIEDKKGQKSTVNVTIAGPAFAMNFSDQYFGYANFTDISVVDQSIKNLKQATFELTCKISGYRGLQTFMGLEGNLIIRGKNDDYRATHPLEIVGLGNKLILESTKSFNLNQWMNIALVVDCDKSVITEKYKLYINGVQDVLIVTKQEETHTAINLTSSSDGNRFEIGRAAGQDFRAMKGIVSEARVWTTARTTQQIMDNMCQLSASTQTGLLARWNFTAGAETGNIQDSNGGKYETNLILANAKLGGIYTQVKVPQAVFVSKGCPN